MADPAAKERLSKFQKSRQAIHGNPMKDRSRPDLAKYNRERVGTEAYQSTKELVAKHNRERAKDPDFIARLSGPNSYLWSGGADPGRGYYGADWRRISKRIIERDGVCCRRCNSRDQLAVHHIIPFSVVMCHDDANLVTLCRSCHSTVHCAIAAAFSAGTAGDIYKLILQKVLEEVA